MPPWPTCGGLACSPHFVMEVQLSLMEIQPMYDVVIVGGGPSGCAVALALCRADPAPTFVLIDDADTDAFKIGESLPGSAAPTLSYLYPALFDRLSLDISRGEHSRCTGNASTWSSEELYEDYSIMKLYGSGWHLDRAVFDESLRNATREACKKTVGNPLPSQITRGRWVSAEKQDVVWSVRTEDPVTGTANYYHAKWLVDATGRKASVAKKLGAKLVKTDKLLAFYSLFVSQEDSEDRDNRTLIEAAESGWWYSSRLSQNRRVVAYHTDDDDPSAKLARTPDAFLELLRNHTRHISEIIQACNYDYAPGGKFPRHTAACSSSLDPICNETEHWCAVGDAAMAFDPLSSQGMITALKTGCFVGEELAKRVAESDEIRSISDHFEAMVAKYEKEKKYHYTQARFDGEFWTKRRV